MSDIEFFNDIPKTDIDQLLISNMNKKQYRQIWTNIKIWVIYIVMSRVISWLVTEITVVKHDIASCYAAMRFDDIIKCRNQQS